MKRRVLVIVIALVVMLALTVFLWPRLPCGHRAFWPLLSPRGQHECQYTRLITHARMVAESTVIYIEETGAYPETVDELVREGFLKIATGSAEYRGYQADICRVGKGMAVIAFIENDPRVFMLAVGEEPNAWVSCWMDLPPQ